MKIQPLECGDHIRVDPNKAVLKSRLKRLFDRKFQRALKITTDNGAGAAAAELEPSSVCLAKMVQNFIEETSDASTKERRNRCNCFTSNNDSDDEFHDQISTLSQPESIDLLKSLLPCSTVAERKLLADASRIFEKNKLHKRQDNETRRFVTDSLASLGYDASICTSRWDKSPSHPAGEYEYIDVILEGERLLIDIDFRSEFQIARPTGSYKSLLQSLPFIYVGKAERLKQIVLIMAEAARQSLKQKGMPFPPWRKAEYMNSKWLAPHSRAATNSKDENCGAASVDAAAMKKKNEEAVMAAAWSPPAVRVKRVVKDGKAVVTGLASLLKGKPGSF
ncbi:unnamed protein product [Rhodiola kirilowii]